MAVNKIVYGSTTLIDLTTDTVTANNLVKNITATGANGQKVVGSMVVQNFYTGTTEPDNSVGSDGDLYLKE